MFLDLPGREEKDAIWQMYLSEYGIDAKQARPSDDHWTGAEIKACCRLASLLGESLAQASQYIVPVGVTAAEDIERLRTWASGRCLDASRPGIFQRNHSLSDQSKWKTSEARRHAATLGQLSLLQAYCFQSVAN